MTRSAFGVVRSTPMVPVLPVPAIDIPGIGHIEGTGVLQRAPDTTRVFLWATRHIIDGGGGMHQLVTHEPQPLIDKLGKWPEP